LQGLSLQRRKKGKRFLGKTFALLGYEKKSSGGGGKKNEAKGVLKPKEAVRRILDAAGAEVSDKEAFWIGCFL
jgi:hypothetical protein